MSTDDDLNALFADAEDDDFVNNIIEDTKLENHELQVMGDEPQIDIKNLQQSILNKTNDMLGKTRDAVEEVLLCVQSEPTNGEVVQSAASMVGAFTKLVGEMNKLNAVIRRTESQERMMAMKTASDKEMNHETNQANLLISQQEVMKMLAQVKNQNINDYINVNAQVDPLKD